MIIQKPMEVPSFGWLQIVGFAGIVEVQIYNEQAHAQSSRTTKSGRIGMHIQCPYMRVALSPVVTLSGWGGHPKLLSRIRGLGAGDMSGFST